MALNDVYQVTDKQSMNGEVILNVYYFQQVNAASTINQLFQLFRDGYIDSVTSVQSNTLGHTGIKILNMTDGLEFLEQDFNTPIDGNKSDARMPTFVSWTFKLERETRLTRNGRKAIAGVVETDTADNVPTVGALTELEAVADIIGAPLFDGIVPQFSPVIYREATTVPVIAPAVVNPIVGATFSNLSTQNTRKVFS